MKSSPFCLSRRATSIPPQAWFVASAVFRYLGPSCAVLLFPSLGVFGVAWVRIGSAALLLAPWAKPWRLAGQGDRRTCLAVVGLGVCLASMNTVFYLALERLPMGLVAGIEFAGTVAVAAWGVRTRRNLIALLSCLAGVLFLTNLRWKSDPAGLALAFLNAALFVTYLVLGHKLSRSGAQAGIHRVGAALAVAAVALAPLGLLFSKPLLQKPALLLAGAGVGICSSVVPYLCDQLAMARLPRASFALMLAILPATAAGFGALVLGQMPTAREAGGILLVMLGVALHRAEAVAARGKTAEASG